MQNDSIKPLASCGEGGGGHWNSSGDLREGKLREGSQGSGWGKNKSTGRLLTTREGYELEGAK